MESDWFVVFVFQLEPLLAIVSLSSLLVVVLGVWRGVAEGRSLFRRCGAGIEVNL